MSARYPHDAEALEKLAAAGRGFYGKQPVVPIAQHPNRRDDLAELMADTFEAQIADAYASGKSDAEAKFAVTEKRTARFIGQLGWSIMLLFGTCVWLAVWR